MQGGFTMLTIKSTTSIYILCGDQFTREKQLLNELKNILHIIEQ